MQFKARRMLIRFSIVLLAFAGFGLAYGAWTQTLHAEAQAASIQTEDLRLNTAQGKIALKVELATNDQEREHGLMFRRTLGPASGMLFVFPQAEPQAFWMKNTYIPLDLIFFDAQQRVVHVAQSAQPFDETPIPSLYPAKYVLEVPGGQAARWQLVDGDKGEGAAFKRGDALALP